MITKLEIERKKKDLTQKQLAKKIGYHSSMISKFERGFSSRVSRRFRKKVSKALGLPEEILFSEKYSS